MLVSLKPADAAPANWRAVVEAAGCTVTANSSVFGMVWCVANGAESIRVVQHETRAKSTGVGHLSEGQTAIVELLIATGVARLWPKLAW